MGFLDDVSRKVKEKAEEWDVQGKAEKLAAEVDKVAHEAKDKAAIYADENRDKVAASLDKAGAAIDERTKGQYADKIVKAKQQVEKSVEKLAEQRPGGPHGPSAPGAEGTTATGSGWAGATDSPTAYPQDSSRPEPYTPEPYRPDPIDPAGPIDEAFEAPAAGQAPAATPPTPTGTGWPQDQHGTPPPPAPGTEPGTQPGTQP